ncbi:MAG: hypothetical protein ACRCYS_20055, partial [Beijerinckiaceae bacterium]
LTRSCGCMMREKPIKHGMARTAVYRNWTAMVQRCTNPNNTRFADWGGRGIKVCDRWRDFANFYADMGEPEAGKTLDRIDNDKGYEPGNCRWATKQEQANNRSVTKRLTFNGQSLSYAEWGRVTGLGRATIGRRANSGWPVERILTEPLR